MKYIVTVANEKNLFGRYAFNVWNSLALYWGYKMENIYSIYPLEAQILNKNRQFDKYKQNTEIWQVKP